MRLKGPLAIGLAITAGLALTGCLDAAHDADVDAGAAPEDAAVQGRCDPEAISAAAYTECRCDQPWPPSLPGAEEHCPKHAAVLIPRVCMVDSSCNVYPFLLGDASVTMPGTPRDDFAIRWDWGEPLPESANLALNTPDEPGSSILLSPLMLFGKKDFNPDEYPFDFQEDDEDAIPGEVLVSEDRRAITVVPSQRCFEGHWYIEAGNDLDAIYGEDVCNLGDTSSVGYKAIWVLE
jgi:hypothetical protein